MHVLIGIAIIIGLIYFAIVSPQFRMAVAGFGVALCLVIIVGTLHYDDSGHLYYPAEIDGMVEWAAIIGLGLVIWIVVAYRRLKRSMRQSEL